MTREQVILNYVNFILSDLKRVERDPYIDYEWGKRTYFWYGSSCEPIIMPGLTDDFQNMLPEFDYIKHYNLLKEMIKLSIPYYDAATSIE